MKLNFTSLNFIKPFRWLVLVLGILSFVNAKGQDAPISTVGTVVTTDVSATVPITAVNFNDIGGCAVKILYDPAIAEATGVILGSQMTGGIDLNFSSGQIIISWYTAPMLNLPDNSVIFNINFDKVSNGITSITWDNSFGGREWTSNYVPLNDIPVEDFYFPGSLTFQGDAPITTAPNITDCPGTQIDIPITVENFNTIGSVSLVCSFNSSVIQYQSYTNNSGFPNLNVGNSGSGDIAVFGTNVNPGGTTLPDDDVLLTLHFNYLGGSTDITWIDDGTSCEYSSPQPLFNPLDDTPQSTYYIDGSVSPDLTPTWTGAVDTVWAKSGNWTCDVPISSSDVTIGTAPNYPTIVGDVVVNSLTIDAGASLYIDPTGSLEVASTLTNNATAADLLLRSDATSTASLLHCNDGVKATIRRYIPASTSNPANPVYHLVSVPLKQEANPLSGLFMWSYLFEFDVQTQDWVALGTPTNTPLEVDQGYMIYKYPGPKGWQPDTTYSFEGPVNCGLFTCFVDYPSMGNNYNLVPNPYPSDLDWNANNGWTRTNVHKSIWFWNPSTGNFASYGDGVGTNGGTQFIPIGQSFFVSTFGTTLKDSPELIMNDDVRCCSSQTFYKGINDAVDLLRLKTVANDFSDETVIRFKEGSTPAFDGDFDVTKFYGNADAPQLYSVAEDDKLLSINSVPFTTDVIVVPMGFELGTAGLITLEVSSIESFDPGVTIYLKDELTGDMIDLRQMQAYSFSHDPVNEPERFKIIFNGTTTIIESSTNQTFCYVSGDQLNIQLPGEVSLPVGLQIFNVNGQLESEAQLYEFSHSCSVSGLNPGVYIVKAFSKDKLFTQKVMVR